MLRPDLIGAQAAGVMVLVGRCIGLLVAVILMVVAGILLW